MSNDTRDRDIARARERADLARMRFGNAVNGVLARLSPDRLRAEAIEAAADQFQQARRDIMLRFRRWPVVAIPLAAASLAILFWQPARRVARWGVRLASLAWTTRQLWRREI